MPHNIAYNAGKQPFIKRVLAVLDHSPKQQ
jgi:hypothetical protein